MASEYIVRGAEMKCNCGSNKRKINLPISHGSYVNEEKCGTTKPILNSDDKTEENISYFGVCPLHGKEEEKIDVIDDKGNLISNGKKCKLELGGEWQVTKEDYLVDGKPALTTDSIMFTNCGGIITFLTSGQED
ncbi:MULTISPECIES: DUF4280 domain-containing protein [Clostridium]|uniref:DUF4280 domain-containing protein n=1 Tax=Clostridium TaxID=1485 RepID=UPI0011DD9DC6|nr:MULTISPECIES: DUF4280 domain-containing protein [Clostridium]MBO1685222.1 DUF4280 domain-containing protein [Clostridium butyricum]MCQ2018183.1 DUF4280 domain-containing protein [Clostridium butyricum]MCQ2022679.1 DUF4280 domain-containing protein [Clostridium butyricum]MDB2138816.1 DUF4280 domain-containing protein [Clostridium butyricum]MDB2156782.1 DUF4280 domain-containing protein [Clostridium butyricum]